MRRSDLAARLLPRGPRALLVAFAVLAATILFLNYRPRAPHVFSTRYGSPYTTGQMVDAICALRGAGVRGQLVFTGVTGEFPDGLRSFSLPATGESFEVSEETCQVDTWKPGSYRPPVRVPAAPTEQYHRALLQRYYPAVPAEQMQLAVNPSGSRRSFRYVQSAVPGVVLDTQAVLFRWNRTGRVLEQIRFYSEPPRRTPQLRFGRLEAEQRALQRAYEVPGLKSAQVARSSREERRARLLGDELGVQRCVYMVSLSNMKWQPGSHALSGCGCEGPPESDMLFVDTASGAVIPPTFGPCWEVGLRRQRLTLAIAGRRQTLLAYPPLRLGLHAYLCGEYLQSKLWAGSYTFDEASGRFTVEDRGRRWRGRRGSRFLHGPEGLSMCWTAPVVIDGELHLPAQMLARITGWSLRWRGGELQVQPPE